jgi:hypothetical protein
MVPVSEIPTPGDTEMIKTTIREAGRCIAKREAFNAGAMRADFYNMTDRMPWWGHLDTDNTYRLRHDLQTYGTLYVVYSYQTPIAWAPAGVGLHVPDARYSPTTTKHQNICRKA